MTLSVRTAGAVAATLVTLSIAPTVSSQPEQCEPGHKTLVGASDVVVRATPKSMTRSTAGGMVYARGTYDVVATARGDVEKTVTVEFSCIDMEAPSGTDDVGHCPGGEGVVLPGFTEEEDGKFRPADEKLPLFLSRTETSPLDSEEVRGDVTFRPFTRCVDGPRDFESPEGEWEAIVAAEKEQRPSSPVEEVTKVAEEKAKKKLQQEKSGCG